MRGESGIRAELREVGGSLARPVSSATGGWTERRGLILTLTDADGRTGQGEASPLPGYSPDTLEEARDDLTGVAWSELPARGDGEPALDWVARCSGATRPASPAARFALETALLDLVGRRERQPMHRLLAPSGPGSGREARPIPLAALLDTDDPIGDARRRVEAGFSTLKLKVGLELARETVVLETLRSELGPEIALRADANGSLEIAEAVAWTARVAELDLEFIEDPVGIAALRELPRLAVPVAIDEPVHASPAREGETDAARLEDLLAADRCRYVVLKPMAVGGLVASMRLAAVARAGGAEVVVSHLLGGPVELAAAAELALALRPATAAGLAPHAGLSAWPGAVVPSVASASLVAHEEPGLGLPRLPIRP